CQRIGDLVFDHLWRLAGILGVDDDLRVGEVRDRVQRKVNERIEAGGSREARADQYQQQVAGRPGDDAGNHLRSPAAWPAPASEALGAASPKPLSAAFKLLSASIRKLADVTTLSPSPSPS